ncbi:uncharacterized protein [Temnothorax nylanderi]|uniref:uncharacterized protein n=1 Tax=Temnothorax nylanderi TaxID=102681 RepID=UPI003A8717EA
MISIEAQYFSLNKILLLAVGLWPYQRTKLVRFRFIFFLIILTTAVLFQFTAFLTSKCTSDLVVKILSVTFFFAIFMINYISFAFNMKAVKNLLTQFQHVYDKLQDECENTIMEKYGYNGKRYTAVLTIFGVCSVFTFTAAEFLSSTFDVLPINVSQARQMQFITEYFVDQERYFSLILLHINVAFCIGLFIIIAGGTMLIVYLQLTCGMFRISSYRIERVMRINMLKNISKKNEKVIFEGIICAIDMHRQAIKLSELLVSKFETMLFCLIAVGVVSLSLNLFQIGSSQDNVKELLFPFLFVTICILYMFLANYAGQNVIDHTNYVFVTAYSVQWYMTPLYIQKTILFLLQRVTKKFTLSLKGLFDGSFECFATLVKASISYFAVIYSIQ